MNKTISNAMLCGLVASTFILVNCQNDPAKRGVKSDVGTPAAIDANGKISGTNFATCSPEFLTAYDLFLKAVVSSRSSLNTKKEDVTATVKESLIRQRTEVIDTGNNALNEMNNLKADPTAITNAAADLKKTNSNSVTGCFKSDDKKNPITIDKLKIEMDRVDQRIANLTGIQSDRAKAADTKLKAQQGISIYNVSPELNEILGLPASATNNYLVDGKFTDSATFIADKDDKAKAVCNVTTGGSKLDENNLVLNLVGNSKSKISTSKDMYELNFSGGSSVYQIKCYLPAGVKFEDGLAQAAGQNLVLNKEAKKEAAVSTPEEKPATPAAAGDATVEVPTHENTTTDNFNPDSSK